MLWSRSASSLYELANTHSLQWITANFPIGMIHTHRKSRGEKDCVVYGLRTDAIGFWFYRIANNGKV